jgi:DNA-binding transcriptional LysR family regulator
MIGINAVNLSGFDLNLLKVLDALLREGSTTRAAERVGLTQPAVSAALRRLRLSLGDELFLRRGQGLVPTDFARSLERPLRDALDGLGELLGGPPDFDPTRSTDVFRISCIDFFAEMLMPGLARELSAHAPGMRVQLIDLVPDAYVEMLEKHQVDIGLLPAMDFPDWLDRRPLFHSSFVTVARKGHRRLAGAGLTPGDTIPIDLFCDLGHVLCSPDGRLKAIGDAALTAVGRERRVVMSLPFFAGVTRVVAESDLVALIPRQLAELVAPRLGLALYRQPMPVRAPLIAMVWHRRARANPAHAWLRDLVARLLTPLNDGEAPLPA